MRRLTALACFAALLGSAAPARACILCGDVLSRQTLRQEARQAKMVLYGTLANARLGAGGNGSTDLVIERVLKDDPIRAGRQTITLPRYVPFDKKNPPKFLVFCDVFNGNVDPYRGTPVQGPAVLDYLQGALAVPDQDRLTALQFYFRTLDSADPEIALDSYLEFAKANDREVGLVGPRLDAAKVRKILLGPQTPPQRLGLFAYLLGACGSAADADLLAGWLARPTERTRPTLSGQLAGYIQLRPREGWDLAVGMLRDPQRPFQDRLAVHNTLRFFHGARPDNAKQEILKSLAVLLEQGELADLATEDLRRWHWWELTPHVLAQYGKPTHDAPLVKRAILRYALSAPGDEAKKFVAGVRAKEPALVADVEESLRLEQAPPP